MHWTLQGSGKAKQLLSIIFLVTFHSVEQSSEGRIDNNLTESRKIIMGSEKA